MWLDHPIYPFPKHQPDHPADPRLYQGASLYDAFVICRTVIDVRINKGNAVQSLMFESEGRRSMGGIMENTSFWILVAIIQPLLYFISLEYFGQIVAIAIPWSILILFLIWMWASGKNPFASDEEE